MHLIQRWKNSYVFKIIANRVQLTIIYRYLHGNNDFAKESKNLVRYRSENNFVEYYQNNYLEIILNMINNNVAKSFDNLPTSLCVILHNYFDDLTLFLDSLKLFLDLCLATLLDTSAKHSFSYTIR